MGGRLQSSKWTMVCVETTHWGDNNKTSTGRGKPKWGLHHQQPGASGLHYIPPHFMPLLEPLKHIATKVYKTATEVCARFGIVRSAMAVGPLLRKAAWISRKTQTHYYVSQISGEDNKESDAV